MLEIVSVNAGNVADGWADKRLDAVRGNRFPQRQLQRRQRRLDYNGEVIADTGTLSGREHAEEHDQPAGRCAGRGRHDDDDDHDNHDRRWPRGPRNRARGSSSSSSGRIRRSRRTLERTAREDGFGDPRGRDRDDDPRGGADGAGLCRSPRARSRFTARPSAGRQSRSAESQMEIYRTVSYSGIRLDSTLIPTSGTLRDGP